MSNITTAEKYTSTSKKEELYSDFFTNIDMHPGKRDLARATNEAAIKRAVTNLLLTDYDERIYQPNLGANLKHLLFEPADSETLILIRDRIKNCLSRFELRIKILSLNVELSSDEYQVNVTLIFMTINVPTPITLNIILNRVR